MKRYTINCHYDMVISVDVIADNEQQAIEKAREQADRMNLNSCAECVGHSESVTDTEELTAEELQRMESDIEDTDTDQESDTLTDQEKGDTLKLLWAMAWAKAQANPDTHRVIVETNEQDPSAPNNEFGRYYMVDYWKAEDTEEGVGRWVVIRVDLAESPFEVHRPNWHHLNGYDDRATQPHCRVSNPDNVTRWAEKMINAGRVVDIYADCY